MSNPETAAEAWVISVCLEENADGVTADEWMDAIEAAIFARDPGFSGTVSMRKEAVDVIKP